MNIDAGKTRMLEKKIKELEDKIRWLEGQLNITAATDKLEGDWHHGGKQ